MSVEIKIPTIDGLTLNTKNKYVKDDIAITIGIPHYDGSSNLDVTPTEDGLITRTLTSYKNDRITEVGRYGLAYFGSLASIELPNVTTVGSQAFRGSGIKSLLLPKVTTIVGDTCHECASLKYASLPLVKVFTQNDFYSCASLNCVDISSAQSLLRNIFNSCYTLKTVIIRQVEKVCSLGSTNVFSNCYHILGTVNATYNPDGLKDGYIYVPDSLIESYKSATNWSTYADQIKPVSEIPQEVKDALGIE